MLLRKLTSWINIRVFVVVRGLRGQTGVTGTLVSLTDINEEAVTFTTEKSRLTYFINDTENYNNQELTNMTSLLLNFRTHAKQGLILFTFDYLHNFLQLHLASPNELVLYFNSGRQPLSLNIQTSSEG